MISYYYDYVKRWKWNELQWNQHLYVELTINVTKHHVLATQPWSLWHEISWFLWLCVIKHISLSQSGSWRLIQLSSHKCLWYLSYVIYKKVIYCFFSTIRIEQTYFFSLMGLDLCCIPNSYFPKYVYGVLKIILCPIYVFGVFQAKNLLQWLMIYLIHSIAVIHQHQKSSDRTGQITKK